MSKINIEIINFMRYYLLVLEKKKFLAEKGCVLMQHETGEAEAKF